MDQVLTEFPDEVDRLRRGESRILAFLMGQVMKRSGGKADPRTASELIRRRTAPAG